jgi:hypothetical protein
MSGAQARMGGEIGVQNFSKEIQPNRPHGDTQAEVAEKYTIV